MAIENPNIDQSAEVRMSESAQAEAPVAPAVEVDSEAVRRRTVAEAAQAINTYGEPKAWSLNASGNRVSKDPEYDKLRARVDAAAQALAVPSSNNEQFFSPEETAKMRQLIDERKNAEALIKKVSEGGVLDATNPAEVAAAMRIIQKETGRTARLSDEELVAFNRVNPASTEKAFVNSVTDAAQADAAQEQLRVANALSQAQEKGPGGVMFTREKVFTEQETFNRTEAGLAVEVQGQLDSELKRDPSVALRRDRRVVVAIEQQADQSTGDAAKSYVIVNRFGDKITLMRYEHQYEADGRTMTDPATWKAVTKEVTVADFMKRGGRLVE